MNYLLLVPNNGNSNWNRKVEIQGQEKLVRLTTVLTAVQDYTYHLLQHV